MANETVLNGRYRLVAQQGSGGMAVIYKAVDQALGRTVAIKILRPSLTNDPAFLARFRNEARSVANLATLIVQRTAEQADSALLSELLAELEDLPEDAVRQLFADTPELQEPPHE